MSRKSVKLMGVNTRNEKSFLIVRKINCMNFWSRSSRSWHHFLLLTTNLATLLLILCQSNLPTLLDFNCLVCLANESLPWGNHMWEDDHKMHEATWKHQTWRKPRECIIPFSPILLKDSFNCFFVCLNQESQLSNSVNYLRVLIYLLLY